jgi:hypothetical protein
MHAPSPKDVPQAVPGETTVAQAVAGGTEMVARAGNLLATGVERTEEAGNRLAPNRSRSLLHFRSTEVTQNSQETPPCRLSLTPFRRATRLP